MKLYRKPNDCMKLHHSHSHHTIRCKESIIYSQVLRYNMIISEDNILQEEFNSLTRILLACVIIKNRKKTLIHNHNHLLSQQTPQTETKILLIVTPFSDIDKLLTAIIHKNWCDVSNDTTLSTIWWSKPLSTYTNYSSIHNHLVHSLQTYGSSR